MSPKVVSWRIQGSLSQWDECLRFFPFQRVQYSLTGKFWDSERSQTTAVKWISLKYFEDHSVLEWQDWIHFLCYTLRSQHEQRLCSLSLARLLHAHSESQFLLRALCKTAIVGTSALVEILSRSRFLEKLMHDTVYNSFPLNTFLPSDFFWSVDLKCTFWSWFRWLC